VALQPLLEAILHQSLRQFPQAEKGGVLVQSEEDQRFRVQASVGYPDGLFEGIAFLESEIVARYTEGTERLDLGVFRVKDLPHAVGFQPLGDLPLPKSLLAMSLVFEGKIAGFLVLESFTSLEAFQETDVEKLQRFRNHAVTALVKAKIFDRLDAATTHLWELNEQKNQFFGIVAHDLRSPLNSIVLAAQLLDGEEDVEEAWRIARQIKKEGMDMSALIGCFLDIAAIESGAIKAEPGHLDLTASVHHILKRHSGRASEKGIAVDITAPEEPVAAWGDGKFLKEVLDNLLSNALKFSPSGTRVTLRVEALDGWARVSVEDQGPGLTAEDQKKLFGRFARLSARPTGGEKSTGLGLSIAKHMVDAMGGRLWVESKPGLGAAFRVELPSHAPLIDPMAS
jgi:signal transduction histidine kinase